MRMKIAGYISSNQIDIHQAYTLEVSVYAPVFTLVMEKNSNTFCMKLKGGGGGEISSRNLRDAENSI